MAIGDHPLVESIVRSGAGKIRLEANIFFTLLVASSDGEHEEEAMSSIAELEVSGDEDPRTVLVTWIRAKRGKLETYLERATSHRRRLLNLNGVTGTLATTLTAAPALGGKPVADWLTATLGLSSPAWRLLCAAAMCCSLTATIATQALKSHSVDERVRRAQAARAGLEMLEVGLSARKIDYAEAVEEYSGCIKDTSFVGGL
ncbi:hypothetical protein [Amycolatopsis sp. NPDC003731]